MEDEKVGSESAGSTPDGAPLFPSVSTDEGMSKPLPDTTEKPSEGSGDVDSGAISPAAKPEEGDKPTTEEAAADNHERVVVESHELAQMMTDGKINVTPEGNIGEDGKLYVARV